MWGADTPLGALSCLLGSCGESSITMCCRTLKQSRMPRIARTASACLTSAFVNIHFSCEEVGGGRRGCVRAVGAWYVCCCESAWCHALGTRLRQREEEVSEGLVALHVLLVVHGEVDVLVPVVHVNRNPGSLGIPGRRRVRFSREERGHSAGPRTRRPSQERPRASGSEPAQGLSRALACGSRGGETSW